MLINSRIFQLSKRAQDIGCLDNRTGLYSIRLFHDTPIHIHTGLENSVELYKYQRRWIKILLTTTLVQLSFTFIQMIHTLKKVFSLDIGYKVRSYKN